MKNGDKPVTKKELEEKFDEFAQMTNASFEKVATKEDLKQFMTKKELKKELAKFVTKDELKQEVAKLATKEDIQKANNELFDRLDNSTYGRLNNHEVRIAKLEVRHR